MLGIFGERAGDRLGIGGVGEPHRQQDGDAAGFAGQADHPVRVGAGRRDQDAPAGRQEGAQRGLGDEVAAALQRQRDVLVRDAAGEAQDPLAQAGEEVAELIVPRGNVAGQRLADLRTGGDGAWDQ